MKTAVINQKTIGRFQYQRHSLGLYINGTELKAGMLRFQNQTSPQIKHTFYLLHGGNGDDLQPIEAGLFETLPEQLVKKLETLGVQFIMPYIGASFLYDHIDPKQSYLRYFKEQIIPEFEKETQTNHQTRFLMGYSTGGQAALNNFLATPQNYRGVGVHFPALIHYDFLSSDSMNTYQNRTGADPNYLKIATQCFQSVFPDLVTFSKYNPLEQIQFLGLPELYGKRIYFDVGSLDEFGLFEGCEIFHESLMKKDIPHFFETVSGMKHDTDFLKARFAGLVSYLIQDL